MRGINFFTVILIFFITSCATFIKNDDKLTLTELEGKSYTLEKDVEYTTNQNKSLKKGDKIKLYIITGDNYIKVYGYPADVSFVKAERSLLLYLFEEDFENNIFNISVFEEKLYHIVKPVK